jgi:hypothetical protein
MTSIKLTKTDFNPEEHEVSFSMMILFGGQLGQTVLIPDRHASSRMAICLRTT